MIAALAINMVVGQTWRTQFTSEFRIDPTATNYKAAISWKPRGDEAFGGPVIIDLIQVRPGPRRLVTSTTLDDSVEVVGVAVHCLPGRSRRSGFESDTWFLSTWVNGGQFDTLLVWHFDPKSLRPKQMLAVLMGDDRRLNKGLVVENSFARYADSELPPGVKDGPTNIHRTWRFDVKTFKFVPGKWLKS